MSEQVFPTQRQQDQNLEFLQPVGTALPTTIPLEGGGIQVPQFTAPSRDATGNARSTTTQQAEPSAVMTTGTTNPTNVPNTASSSSGGGGGGSNLSSGAVAGVAIACLIIGAGLAFAAAFFFFKRRNNKKTPNGKVSGYDAFIDSTPELVMMQKNVGQNSAYVQVSQMPHSQHTSMTAVAPMPVQHQQQQPSTTELLAADILPAAAHESEVQSRVAALFGQIHRHVETYYRDVHASITPSMESDLARFGAKDVNMAELLQDISSPVTALKHALVAYIISITSPSHDDECVDTLFPEQLNTPQLSNADPSASDPTHANARLLHRRLSVYLYTSACTSPSPPARRSWSNVQSDLREAAEHFSLTFFPWANPVADDQEKEDDLARIIADVLQMRVWLFGQPAEFAFRWDGVGSRGVVVAPELVVVVARWDGGEGDSRGRVVLEGGVVGV